MKFARFWGARNQRSNSTARLLLGLVALGLIFFLFTSTTTTEVQTTPDDVPVQSPDDDVIVESTKGKDVPTQPTKNDDVPEQGDTDEPVQGGTDVPVQPTKNDDVQQGDKVPVNPAKKEAPKEDVPVQPKTNNRPAQSKPERPLPPHSLYSVKIPNVVGYDPEDEDSENKMRRDTVKEAFRFAYEGYRDHCMGQGELKPESGHCHNWLGGNLGLTVIDSLDTMLVMGHDDLYKEAREWIAHNLNFAKDLSVSVFEITIRCLGGLLTAFDMTKDQMMLEKAQELADRLLPAFKTSTGIPFGFVTLTSGATKQAGWAGGASLLAEMGSLQLEFSYLSHATGNPIYAEKALRVFKVLHDNKPADGLYPVFINPHNLLMRGPITVGAIGDSFYEYLLKYWLLTNVFFLSRSFLFLEY
eukprot:TRINITY_DN59_c0_g2_i1.p1 TRINITY_DN59_c0_g2~~TRINITY_DN59_c0_g2_i1.p1  ORF type:complete len:421 (+),score=79.87 TRINITY_DN59_c0_g2_i1:27-1265(+)